MRIFIITLLIFLSTTGVGQVMLSLNGTSEIPQGHFASQSGGEAHYADVGYGGGIDLHVWKKYYGPGISIATTINPLTNNFFINRSFTSGNADPYRTFRVTANIGVRTGSDPIWVAFMLRLGVLWVKDADYVGTIGGGTASFESDIATSGILIPEVQVCLRKW